jgi:hypothetical protein
MPNNISEETITKLKEGLGAKLKTLYGDDETITEDKLEYTATAAIQIVDDFMKEQENYVFANTYFQDQKNLDTLVKSLATENKKQVATYLKGGWVTRSVAEINVEDTLYDTPQCIFPEEIKELTEQLNSQFEELFKEKSAITKRHIPGAVNQVVAALVAELQKSEKPLADAPNLAALATTLREENQEAVEKYLDSWALANRTVSNISVKKAITFAKKEKAEEETKERAAAATKIQAAFRGKQAHKKFKAKKGAAIKIQSTFRGHKTRKALEEEARKKAPETPKKETKAPETPKKETKAPEPKKETKTVKKKTADFFKEVRGLAEKQSLKELQASGRSVMVLGNEGMSTIVLSAINKFVESQLSSSKPKGTAAEESKEERLAKLFMATKGTALQDKAKEINEEVNTAIEAKIKDKTLTNLSPSAPVGGKTTYEHKEASLVQTGDDDKGYKFKPQGKFNGVLRVQRMVDGELSDKNIDVVEYKDGKPIAVSMAIEGKCRIADIGLIKREVEITAGVAVSTKIETGVEVTGPASSSFSPSQTPASSKKVDHKER